ncbi:MAG: RING finger protein [Planctomycetota bacterium]|nr:RING finger protein [Planctomycetota bacterium]
MKVSLNERWRREICPFCKDGFEQDDTHSCENCSTVMHEECFQENGGCAVLGCDTKTKDWPRCSQCSEQLTQLSAVLCIHCGYNQETGRYVEGAPGRYQASPERGNQDRQGSRVVIENPDAVNWDLPNSGDQKSSISNSHLPVLVMLNVFSWLGIAVFGILTFILFIAPIANGDLRFSITCLAISSVIAWVTNTLLSNKT